MTNLHIKTIIYVNNLQSHTIHPDLCTYIVFYPNAFFTGKYTDIALISLNKLQQNTGGSLTVAKKKDKWQQVMSIAMN